MTPANERKAAERQRRKEAGLVRIEMWVPPDKIEAVRAAVAKMVTEDTTVRVDPIAARRAG